MRPQRVRIHEPYKWNEHNEKRDHEEALLRLVVFVCFQSFAG